MIQELQLRILPEEAVNEQSLKQVVALVPVIATRSGSPASACAASRLKDIILYGSPS